MTVVTKRRAGRPTRDDTLRKSERLLEAATALFVARGFDGTTMEAIALAANMGKQAVYMRFPDKESVFTAVIQRLKEKDDAVEIQFDDTLPLSEGLPGHIEAIMTDASGPIPRLVAHLAFREGHRFPALVQFLSDATTERFIRPLAASIDKAKAAGEARDVDSLAAASLCVDLVFSEITRTVFRQTPLSPAEIRRLAGEIAGFVLLGLAKHV